MKLTLTLVLFVLLLLVSNVNVRAEQQIWSETGSEYKITSTEPTVTEKNYTIKAVEFPYPVRGVRSINGSIGPETPIIPFVTFEIYKDILNNPNPIDKFSLQLGDEYITSDDEIKIVMTDIPGGSSQNWVYEYYDAWATIKIYRRGLPSLSADITIKDIEEDEIDPGDKFKIDVKIKNTGEDTIKSINVDIIDPLSLLIKKNISENIYILEKGEEKILEEISLDVPKFTEEREYDILVNAYGHDTKDIVYTANTSKKIKVRPAILSVKIEKNASKDSVYLKEFNTVVLTISNRGNLPMYGIQIYDFIPDKLIYIRNSSKYEFFLNKSIIKEDESWSFDYTLKPLEPGIYVLPKFEITFSMGGKDFEMASNEAGFRVFGPKVIISKSITKIENPDIDGISIDTSSGNNIEVKVSAKNIGNGFTRVVIKDELPKGATLVSGKLNLTTSLNPDEEKFNTYIIRTDIDVEEFINKTLWPPVIANYFLDDYKFNTSSNDVPIRMERQKREIQKEDIKSGELKKDEDRIDIGDSGSGNGVPVPTFVEEQKRVVATISPKDQKMPIKTQKKTPGFEIIIGMMILILLGKNKKDRS